MPQAETKFCERCGDPGATARRAETAYYWDGTGEDPNRNFWACDHCYQEYHDYWQERWDDYWAGLL